MALVWRQQTDLTRSWKSGSCRLDRFATSQSYRWSGFAAFSINVAGGGPTQAPRRHARPRAAAIGHGLSELVEAIVFKLEPKAVAVGPFVDC